MAQYCKALFGLESASLDDVSQAIAQHLRVWEEGGVVNMEWSLLYVMGDKPRVEDGEEEEEGKAVSMTAECGGPEE